MQRGCSTFKSSQQVFSVQRVLEGDTWEKLGCLARAERVSKYDIMVGVFDSI